MSKINFQKGFRRVAWVISAIGLIIFVVGLVMGIIVLANYMKLLANEKFQSLPLENQKRLKEKLMDHWSTEYEYVEALAIGAVWFFLVWVIYFPITWIVKGFVKKE